MKKTLAVILSLLMLLGAAPFGIFQNSTAEAADRTVSGSAYVLVEADKADWSGEYLIVYTDGAVYYALNSALDKIDAVNNFVDVTTMVSADGKTISGGAETAVAVEANGSGYSILAKNGKYLNKSGDANGLEETETAGDALTIAIGAEGEADIVAAGGTHFRYNMASNQCRFRFYKSATYTNQQSVLLYEKVTGDEPIVTSEPTDEPTPAPTDEPTPATTDEPTPELTEEPTATPTGESATDSVYVLVEADKADWSGEYLIVYTDGTNYYAMDSALEMLNVTNNFVDVTTMVSADGKTISGGAEAAVALEANGTGYAAKAKNGNYFNCETEDKNTIEESTEPGAALTVALGADGEAEIVTAVGAHLRYNTTENQNRFRFYKATTYANQQPILLYAKTNGDEPIVTSEPTAEPTATPTAAPSGTALLGDVNLDGAIGAADAAQLLRFLVGMEEPSDLQALAADVNGDGAVTSADAAIILRYAVGVSEISGTVTLPSDDPTPEPTEEPTPKPTQEPTPAPTATPVPDTGDYSDYPVNYTGTYYNSIGSYEEMLSMSASSLRNALKSKISTSTGGSYSGLKSSLPYSDTDSSHSGQMRLFYSQEWITQTQNLSSSGWSGWNREHCWPDSLGGSICECDIHVMRPTYPQANNHRGNSGFGEFAANESKSSSTSPAGTLCGYYSNSKFEPNDNVKGDVARIVFYILTHNSYSSLSFSNIHECSTNAAGYAMFVEWNEMDPPDSVELNRNNYAYNKQGNRNPYIDFPALAEVVFGA